jgi:hypothetical protein
MRINKFSNGRRDEPDHKKAADAVSGMVWLSRKALDCRAVEEPITAEHRGRLFPGHDAPQAASTGLYAYKKN